MLQVHVYPRLYHVVDPSGAKLELVKWLQGSLVYRFIPCSSTERTESNVGIKAPRYVSNRKFARRSGVVANKIVFPFMYV